MIRMPVALLFAALLTTTLAAQSVPAAPQTAVLTRQTFTSQAPSNLPPFHAAVARPNAAGIKAPTPLVRVEPKYTPETLRAKIEGSVAVEALVDATGVITDARVIQPLEPTLDANALTAAKAWKFLPGTKDGEAVPVVVMLVMEYRLH
jgi:protein TonB